ncbi:MAG: type IX secretion system sortase PorU [Gemmatimonadetes bacterium]|nr:type IX secretion system sortase PorU [Gemmatimonadota bacterium]
MHEWRKNVPAGGKRRNPPLLTWAGVALCCLTVFAGNATAAGEAPVTLISEGPEGLTFRYSIPAPAARPLAADDSEGVEFALPGHVVTGAPGSPAVPTFGLLLGIPPGARYSVSVRDAVVETVRDAGIGLIREPNLTEFENDIPDPSRAADSWYRAGRPGNMAGRRVFDFEIRPVRYDAASDVAEVLREATFEVRFEGGRTGGAASRKVDGLVGDRHVLNGASSAAWTTGPSGEPRTKRLAEDGFHKSGNWVRMEIRERGIYRVTYQDLQNAGIVNPGTAIGDPRTVRVYSGTLERLPESTFDERLDWMNQVAIRVIGESDGSFDPGDVIEFPGNGVAGWAGEFDPLLETDSAYYQHQDHLFVTSAAFWLTWGGDFEEPALRMGARDATPGTGALVTTSLTAVHHETNTFADLTRSGTDLYFWDEITKSRFDKTYRFLDMPRYDSTETADMRVQLIHHANERTGDNGGSQDVRFSLNNEVVDSLQWVSTSIVNGQIVPGLFEATTSFGMESSNRVRLEARRRAELWLNWIEFRYTQRLVIDDALEFRAPPGDWTFVLQDLSGDPVSLYDVTDRNAVTQLTGVAQAAGLVRASDTIDRHRTYLAVAESGYRSPASLSTVVIDDLRNPASGGDYVVIVADRFADGIGKLLQHRALSFQVKTVRYSQVVHQFGWGLKDPVAVRDFLHYAFLNWPEGERPQFAVMIGDATSDVRELLPSTLNVMDIPTFPRIDRRGRQEFTYPTDDFFSYLVGDSTENDRFPDIAIGRIPVGNTTELGIVIDKIVDYETNPEFGAWRNRVLFLADDELKGSTTDGDCAFTTSHTTDTERSAELIPPSFDVLKNYLMEYPIGSNGEKPLAQAAYIEQIQRGFIISSYIGHGGFDKMADENLFSLTLATPELLQNGRRLHLFTAWSCSIGSFDLQTQSSLAERLLVMNGAGSIGSFSSGAPAFGNLSVALNLVFFEKLFLDTGGSERVGTAALIAKADRTSSISKKINDEKYNLIGDPALRLAVPELRISFDSGDDLTFQRTRQTTLTGRVIDQLGEPASWFDGTMDIFVRGMADTSGYLYTDSICTTFPQAKRARYFLQGPTFFRGTISVRNGEFAAPFFVPRDTRVGDLGRVVAYSKDLDVGIDASGGLDSIAIEPEPANAEFEDTLGPATTILIDGAPIRNGISLTRTSAIEITLEDDKGINLQRNDDFFTIQVGFDGGRAIDVTELFEYELDSFRKGSLQLRIADLSGVTLQEGPHDFSFRVADNLNNRTVLDYTINLVTEGSDLAFQRDVLNYPNPFNPDEEETEFFVDLTRSASVTIEIFTLTGRRIRTFPLCEASGPTRLIDCRWDGRDTDGDVVANGTYLVRATALSDDGETEIESIGKVVVLRGVE